MCKILWTKKERCELTETRKCYLNYLVLFFLRGIFEDDSEDVKSAFKYALYLHNKKAEESSSPTKFFVDHLNVKIQTGDTYSYAQKFCYLLKQGIFAVFGSADASMYDTAASFSNVFSMPYLSIGRALRQKSYICLVPFTRAVQGRRSICVTVVWIIEGSQLLHHFDKKHYYLLSIDYVINRIPNSTTSFVEAPTNI
ncbi:Glutamate receptor 1 [Nymphon striatum]|nr:Glutamate receptor 1 [Nymphon striatum]